MEFLLVVLGFVCGSALVYIVAQHRRETIRELNQQNKEKLAQEEQAIRSSIESLKQQQHEKELELTNSFAARQNELNRALAAKQIELQLLDKDYEAKQQLLLQSIDNKRKELEDQVVRETDQKKQEVDAYVSELKANADMRKQQLEDEYLARQANLAEELDALRVKRDQIIAAQMREEAAAKQKDFYRLAIGEEDREDVSKLLRLAKDFHNPQPLRKLVWSEYFLKPSGELAGKVLGKDKVCGIYKLTNQLDQRIYIGQSTDVKTRWQNHIKASLGIDSIAHSRVHDAMASDGVWNFTFELLEQCNKDQLNEREKFYIDFYKSNVYGYNKTIGGS